MRLKIFSLRWKIIALFGASILLSLFCVTTLIQLVHQVGVNNRTSSFYLLLKNLQTRVGVLPLGAIAGFAFFILFFFFLSRSSLLYMEKISRTLQQISLGKLDVVLPPRSQDELGELAENINRMASRLKAALEEERNAERTKNELITSLSHDLRTPLTSILGYLELIGQGRETDSAALRRYADIALQKSRQLKTLIDDLFEYTSVRQGQLKFQPTRIDLRELLAQLREEFAPTFQTEERTCLLSAAETQYPVRADGDLIVRVFENILSNAVRYGRRGGVVDIDLSRDGAWSVVRLANTGNPIPAGDLPRVFDRFYRSEASRSEESGGSGLGLAIAKSIVDLHGGRIAVKSAADRTVFEVRLKSDS
ncbi:MAG: HAMP domain-containing histidine kinase [Candidatus Aminicenantes bacterium]|nr:HAMP domain-containing histidine kinase [Candidatus Aminicenantes bacterium]